jgi:TRAP-type C4-dicarboxylate transport system permease small subunit
MLARIWDKSLEVLVATSYVVIVVVGFAQVLFRFFF